MPLPYPWQVKMFLIFLDIVLGNYMGVACKVVRIGKTNTSVGMILP